MGKIIQKLKNKDEEVIVNGGSQLDHVIAKIKSKEKKLTIILACIICFCILVVGYVLFSSIQDVEEFHTIKTNNLEINYDDGTKEFGDAINLYALDKAGYKSDKVYNVSISNTSDEDVYYTLMIVDDEDMIEIDGCSDKVIDKSYVRYKVDDMATIILGEDEKIIESVLKPGENVNYKLRVWLDSSDVNSGHYHGRIVVKEKKD